MIAMALACEPDLIIADEPTTALDVSIQAQIIEVLLEIKARLGTAMLLITHDLGVVAEMADRVAVLYAGHVVEVAEVGELFDRPRHPYTEGLLAAVPRLDQLVRQTPGTARLAALPGGVPAINERPPGCPFAPRCPVATARCSEAHAAHDAACRNPRGCVLGARCMTALVVEGLRKDFPQRRHLFARPGPPVRAVDDVSFEIAPGETLGLVGESGCGKSTLARLIMRMITPTAGAVLVDGKRVANCCRAKCWPIAARCR